MSCDCGDFWIAFAVAQFPQRNLALAVGRRFGRAF
jgi:hypothetical protein